MAFADYDVQKEKIEVLGEFLSSGTWDTDTNWSNEAASLRRLAVSEPNKIDEQFVWNHFETLRLIDKKVQKIENLFFLQALLLSFSCSVLID